GTWGQAAALRCMAVAQGLDQSSNRILIAAADSTGGAANYGLYRKVGAAGAGTWALVSGAFASGGFQVSGNKAPSLYWVDATHIYAYDAVAKAIYRASNLEL